MEPKDLLYNPISLIFQIILEIEIRSPFYLHRPSYTILCNYLFTLNYDQIENYERLCKNF